jgi:hypothetical protein
MITKIENTLYINAIRINNDLYAVIPKSFLNDLGVVPDYAYSYRSNDNVFLCMNQDYGKFERALRELGLKYSLVL